MLPLFLFLLPFQTVLLLRESTVGGEKWQYGTIGIYATDILLVFSIGLFASEGGVTFREWPPFLRRLGLGMMRHLPGQVFLLLLFWAGLSVSWAPDPILAVYGFIRILLALGVFLLVREAIRGEWEKRIAWALILSALLQSLVGIGQFVTQETFSFSFLGTSEHPVWEAGTSVLKNDSGRWLRAYGTFPHPNMYGLFVAVGLLLSVWELIESSYGNGSERGRGRKFPFIPFFERGWDIGPSSASFRKGEEFVSRLVEKLFSSQPRRLGSSPLGGEPGKRPLPLSEGGIEGGMASKRASFVSTLLLASIPLLLLGLILSFSRSAWTGFVFGLLALVVYRILRGGRESRKLLQVPLFTLLFSVALFGGLLYETVFPRFDSVVVERERSVTDRMTTYRDAWRIVRESTFLGVGTWNSTSELIRLDPGRPVWDIQPAHDIPLLVLAELGIPGLALFLFGGVMFLVRIIRQDDVLALAIFLAFLPSMLFDHFLWSSHFGVFLLSALAGYAFSSEWERKEKRLSSELCAPIRR